MKDKIDSIIEEINQFSIEDSQDLEKFRIQYLGTKGLLKDLFGELKSVPNEEKKRSWTTFKWLANYSRRKI